MAGTSTLVRSANLLNDPVIRRHVVSVGTSARHDLSLLAGGRRSRRLGTVADRQDGADTGPAGSSSSTWAMPRRDSRTGASDCITAFRRHPGLEFILLAGDLVDRGNERTNWDHFFLRAEEVFERMPVMPCVGNHEYLDRGPQALPVVLRPAAERPGRGSPPGLVYHFEVGVAFIAVLDSTLAVADARGGAASGRLARRGPRPHPGRVEARHVPPPGLPSHPWRDTPALRDHWVPVFDKHHVDLVLQGHDHAYLRTYPMRGNRRVSDGRDRDDLCRLRAGRQVLRAGRPRLHRGRFHRDLDLPDDRDRRPEHRLTYRAWTDAGEVVDRLVLTRPGPVEPAVFAGREREGVR